MVSPLDTAIRKQVAQALRGKLLSCTLRRTSVSGVDALGDPVPGAASTFAFDGIRDSFTLAFAQAAGIPVTDAKIFIVLGSLATSPRQDDQVKIRSQWFQLRSLVEADPAGATETWAGFDIPEPA